MSDENGWVAVQRASGLARRGLPRDAFESWVASSEAAGQPLERVLAWAGSTAGAPTGVPAGLSADVPIDPPADVPAGIRADFAADPTAADDLVIGTLGRLSVRSAGGDWLHVGWHRIERGGWNGDARRLSWTGYDGVRGGAALPAPGRVPELFRERIAASIAVEEIVEVGHGRSVVVSGRRDLSRPEAPLEWRTSLSRGLSWQQPGLRALADDTLARLQLEYGRG